jgi:hypothetical protein
MVALTGLQLCQLRRNREILFVLVAGVMVFGFAFQSSYLHSFVMNLNHFLFLSLGYIAGKLKFEYERKKNQKASKGRTPRLPEQKFTLPEAS